VQIDFAFKRQDNGAQFSFEEVRSGILPIGTVFAVIDNTAARLVDGTFSNLLLLANATELLIVRHPAIKNDSRTI
jgi:hypothetical protein